MSTVDLKELGPPFPAAEIQVSVKKKVARLLLVLRNPSLDFPLGERSANEMVDEILKAARVEGLIDDNTAVSIIDLDSLPTN